MVPDIREPMTSGGLAQADDGVWRYLTDMFNAR